MKELKEMTNYDKIRERLRHLSENKAYSTSEFAKKAGIEPSNMLKMLKGQQTITAKTLKKISAAYGINEEWLRTGNGEPDARRIIEKYKGRDHLLSVMDGRADYHSFMRRWNIALKKIGTQEVVPDKIGKRRKIIYHPLFPDITTYTARYTFASIAANDLDISEVQIGRCLGHSWSKTVTARYIADDRSKVDMVVRRVAEYVNG